MSDVLIWVMWTLWFLVLVVGPTALVVWFARTQGATRRQNAVLLVLGLACSVVWCLQLLGALPL